MKQLKCQNCGAPLHGSKCEYCGSIFFDEVAQYVRELERKLCELKFKLIQTELNLKVISEIRHDNRL